MKTAWQLDENTLYRSVSGELVVIQLTTGEFFYFNAETESFLERFRAPKKADENWNAKTRELFEFLVENRILKSVDDEGFEFAALTGANAPAFLRKGRKKLDEMTFLCP